MRGNHASLAVAQGGYYLVTGLWPLIHMRSFLRVTGPKTELWLVRTVGLLAAAIGATLVRGARAAGQGRGDAPALGAASALAFIAADVPHALTGRISPVYLLDAAIEAGFVAAWARAGRAP